MGAGADQRTRKRAACRNSNPVTRCYASCGCIWAAASGKKGISRRTGQIGVDALRIRTTNGLATARDKIKLTFDIVALPERNLPFESRQIAGRKYQFVKAEKV